MSLPKKPNSNQTDWGEVIMVVAMLATLAVIVIFGT